MRIFPALISQCIIRQVLSAFSCATRHQVNINSTLESGMVYVPKMLLSRICNRCFPFLYFVDGRHTSATTRRECTKWRKPEPRWRFCASALLSSYLRFMADPAGGWEGADAGVMMKGSSAGTCGTSNRWGTAP